MEVVVEKKKRVYKPRVKKVDVAVVSEKEEYVSTLKELTALKEEYSDNLEKIKVNVAGGWYNKKAYTFKTKLKSDWGDYDHTTSLSLCGMITGCGIAQMNGISTVREADIDKALELIEQIKKDGAKGYGCIVATLGANYFTKQPIVEKLGFREVAEYCNYQHGSDGKYKQKLFILTY